MLSSTPSPTPQKPASLPASDGAQSVPVWGRLETLWLLVAPLCALLYTLCLTLAPNDLWYHVRAGELISGGAIPTQNLMSTGVALGAPFYYQSWLAELGLFWSLKLGGLSGLVILRALCVTGALGLVTIATFRQLLRLENPPPRLLAARLSAFSAIIGFAMISNNLDLRPQTFSALLFGLWIFAALEFRAPNADRRVWGTFLVVLTLIWANTHGAFIISILGLGAFALGDFFSNRPRFRVSLGVALTSIAAVLINPRGAALYVYVASLSSNRIGQKWIQEWKSPGFDEWHSVLFWLCVAALAVLALSALVRMRIKSPQRSDTQRSDSGSTLFLTVLAIMAARDQRSILWFALFFVPVFAAQLALWTRPQLATDSPLPVSRAAQAMNAVLLGFLLALPLTLLPQFKANWPWPTEFVVRFAPTPASFDAAPPLILERTTPVAAAQFLLAHPPRGRLWTDMVCGSYLTYAGRGQIRPLCDPRIELFPDAFWEDYLRLSAGPPDAAQILQGRGFSDALLDRVSMPGLVQRLKADPNWQIVAQNGSTVLFRQLSSKKS